MFTTPLRSENIPAIAPNTSGVANPNVWAISVASKTVSRFPVPERVARMPRPIPSRPATTAPQPSRRRPRVAVQIPRTTATMPTAIGQVERARLDRRDREEGGEHAEAERRRSRSWPGRAAVADGVLEARPQARHAAASVGERAQLRRRRAALARVPDVEDQEVGADEEHDEPQDDVRQVPGELGLDHVRAEAVRRPVEQAAEEQ